MSDVARHILVIDDDTAITSMLMAMLSKAGYVVTVLNDSRRIKETDISRFDLIICDVMMPHLDGFTLVRHIRDTTPLPILFLTAKVTQDDALEGYASGADDYIRKPFSMAELLAKVAAQLRRSDRVRNSSDSAHTHNILYFDTLNIDLISEKACAGDEEIPFTSAQWLIVSYLATHPHSTFSTDQLGEILEIDSGAVAMHISNIRAKFKKYNLSPISTVWGVGYRWAA